MENLSFATDTNVVFLEARKQNVSFLTILGKSDPDVKEFVRLVNQYDMRDKAVALLEKKLARKRHHRPIFFKNS